MKQLPLPPIAHVEGDVYLPGSKSISNRALLLAALSEGETTLTNLLDSDDIRHMLNALALLGVSYQWQAEKGEIVVQGRGGPIANSDQALELFLGNAGTAMRPLCAALVVGQGDYVLTGEPRMKERPIGHLVDALRPLGAKVEYLEAEGYPPLRIHASQLAGGRVSIDGSISSQFLTALLMTAPLCQDTLTIDVEGELVSKPYIDITLALMAKFGVEVENRDYRQFVIAAGQRYVSPGRFLVEGDASSASYFLAAAAIGGGPITVHGVGRASLQGDKYFADALAAMGAEIEWQDESITARRGELNGIDMDMNHIPDAAMTIATTALFAKGPTTIRNVYNWRVKETDRLAAMATELKKVGAVVEEGHDYLRVEPVEKLHHAAIDTYNDHRIAMCFSLLAVGGVPVTINDPGCTAKTFPDYFDRLNALCR
ncbi:3-phosphoshikimate 1-carboxyvinyltransferase [Ferrimonas balearica DSM 9799]|uniref:3-phosphoshikimate 1-carboxyvinyltransferase n=1 Tax=Ferrimonas balearica (strain DSM 9799 / CCM 4581 / KCTC 23876 / PAT) TaxID=550540 RepID=E1STN0_FERBD|nr:3-phosphoshikimate 1-carboxyvinyltransferase [Ferrimonas balearica]ADN76143.1 3-phosphoshikimate 1-carboxyvinyltransferase [Ferrimonas balearica DSM 9799]